MFLEIIKAQHIEEYKIELDFSNGEKKIIDLKNHLEGEIFQPLKDISFLQNFTIPNNTIEWSNGADFAPEYLYKIASQQEVELEAS